MKVGDLVTERTAPEGAPTWIGVLTRIDEDADVRLLGSGLECFWVRDLRPITDSEAAAIVTALTWEAWTWKDDVGSDSAHLIVWDEAPKRDPLLWIHAHHMGRWVVVFGQWRVEGYAGCDIWAQADASRAFLAHLCTGGQASA